MKKISQAAKLAQRLLTYLEGGFTLQQAAKFTSQETKSWDREFREKLKLFNYDLEKGYSPEEAAARLRKILPDFFLELFILGATRGTLIEALYSLKDYYEYQHKFINRLKEKLYYPLISLVIFIALIFLMVYFVLPVLLSLYDDLGLELPKMLKYLIFIISHPTIGRVVLITPLVIFGGCYFFRKQLISQVKIARLLLVIPIIGRFFTSHYTALFLQGLYLNLKTGREIGRSLESSALLTGNRYIILRNKEVIKMIEGGESLTKSLKKWLPLDENCWDMLVSGEKAGKLLEMTDFAGNYYKKATEKMLDKTLAKIEPISILLLASMVAFTALILLNPIWSLFNNLTILF